MIIVLAILTATVVLNIGGEESIINKVREAVFKNDVRTYQEKLKLKVSEKRLNALENQNVTEGIELSTDNKYKDILDVKDNKIVLK